MQAKFICHRDFENLKPIDVFHKELFAEPVEQHTEGLCNRHTLFRKKLPLFLMKLSGLSNKMIKIKALPWGGISYGKVLNVTKNLTMCQEFTTMKLWEIVEQ